VTATSRPSDRFRLHAIAVAAMRARGLDPEFPAAALLQATERDASGEAGVLARRDLRERLWCSIDNDDSLDLDQLSVAEPVVNGTKILVAIADVDGTATMGSPIDHHAAINTTSVYTPAAIFPMLPPELSTNRTSLLAGQDRDALVVEFVVAADGSMAAADVYAATVNNKAKLAYSSVGAWLEGHGPLPPVAAAVTGMDEQLRIQDRAAQALSRLRHEHGALQLETIDVRHEFDGDALRNVQPELPNRAKALIENLMIAANGVTARFLDARGLPSIRRVVREPERWDRIVELAAGLGGRLPSQPDARALAAFLAARRSADPDGFTDLSHTIVKLLGSGEYVVDRPGADPPGHFGLSVKDYTHSTAPNRRYPDLLTQRLLKSALNSRPTPYTIDDLDRLAAHCTTQEDAANKVERQVRKSAAALLVESRVGEGFDAVVTGVTPKGTFLRVISPPIEGMLVGGKGVDVGDHVGVQLTRVDVERGYIDFVRRT
jgi:exoribonuclease-2